MNLNKSINIKHMKNFKYIMGVLDTINLLYLKLPNSDTLITTLKHEAENITHVKIYYNIDKIEIFYTLYEPLK